MLNKTLAFTIRAFRVDVRSTMSHLLRLALAVIVLLYLSWVQGDTFGASAPGLWLFRWIVYTNAVLLTLIAPLYFSNAITEEKEERTLAMLKVADVGPAAIVLGKALPRLVTLIFVVIVQFPFALLAITLGGVTFAQVMAAYVALLAYAIAVGCLALFCSTMMRLTANAVGAAGLLLLGYFLTPPLSDGVSAALRFDGNFPGVATAFGNLASAVRQTNVFHQIGVALTSGFAESAVSVQLISNLAAGALFFLLSIVTFNFFNQNVDAAPVASKRKRMAAGRESRRAWGQAIVWKEFLFGTGGWKYVVGKFLLYGLVLVGLSILISDFGTKRPKLSEIGNVFASLTFFAFIPIEMTLMISRLFHTEIKEQTLSTLVLLPKSIREICWGKIFGGLLGVIPALSYLLLGLLLNPEIVFSLLKAAAKEPLGSLVFLINFVGHLLLFWHLIAAFSLRMNGWWAICLSVLLQYFGSIIFYMIVALLGSSLSIRGSDEWVIVGMLLGCVPLGLAIFLHYWIGQQLKVKAAAV